MLNMPNLLQLLVGERKARSQDRPKSAAGVSGDETNEADVKAEPMDVAFDFSFDVNDDEIQVS